MESLVKILIVDDDDVCRELLRETIAGQEVEIFLAADGIEALKFLHADALDILITDLNMPRMDGLKLLAEARGIHPHIVSIIITGYGTLESAIEAIRQGAYDYIQKPFKIGQIEIVTRNAIEKIKILRDKARLLQELEGAYQRVQALETEFRDLTEKGKSPAGEEASEGGYYYLPRHALPLFCLDVPRRTPAEEVLLKLERLMQLKSEGVINEQEFLLLKKTIIGNLEFEKL